MSKIYTILDFPKKGANYGMFKAKSPKRAGYKVLSKLAKLINLTNTNNKNYIVFSIKDITPSLKNKNKIYKYVGTRVELFQPKIIYINGKKITYKFVPVLTKYADYFS